MGTQIDRSRIAAALFGKTRRKVLALLFGQPERSFFLREIVRATDVGQGSVQRELGNLVEAALVTRENRGHQVYFRANPRSPVFPEIRSLVVKVCGVGAAVQESLVSLGDAVEVAFLFGSIVTGEERPGSDVDVMVIGDAAFGDVVEALAMVEGEVGRPINPTVYRRSEFQTKLDEGNHFLTKVMNSGKEVVIGDIDDLASLG